MRACARLILVLIAVFASLGLAGCDSIDELKGTMSGWFATEKSEGGHEGKPSGLPEVADTRPPEKILGEESSKVSKKKDNPGRKLQRPQTADLPKKPPASASREDVKPNQGGEAQSASSQAAPVRLHTPWPEPPASGTFTR
jgi:hypothetical protein